MLTPHPAYLREMAIITRFEQVHQERAPTASLKSIARDANIPRSILANWRYGRITRFDSHTLDKLCTYFNCQPGDLLEWVPTLPLAEQGPPGPQEGP